MNSKQKVMRIDRLESQIRFVWIQHRSADTLDSLPLKTPNIQFSRQTNRMQIFEMVY